jgi:hypothetical protein
MGNCFGCFVVIMGGFPGGDGLIYFFEFGSPAGGVALLELAVVLPVSFVV